MKMEKILNLTRLRKFLLKEIFWRDGVAPKCETHMWHDCMIS